MTHAPATASNERVYLEAHGSLWVISPLIWVECIVTLLITLLITTHEPPSRVRV